jgi:hypothetical protein
MTAVDQDLAQSFRDLLDHITKLRHGHATALAEAQRAANAHELVAASQGAVDVLDSLLESDAAVRGRRALVRIEWAR